MRIETERLILRPFTPDDAAFVVVLLNEPSFIANIGDRGVRTVEDAVAYLAGGPIASYEANGHGLLLMELRDTGEPIGMCGLLRRAQFADVDVGYSILPAYWRRGYAAEAVAATLRHGREVLGIGRIIALVSPHNTPSASLLEKLGFTFVETVDLLPAGIPVRVYEQLAAP